MGSMAESFSRWESDPLFSAAEVVQDSADRMESVFRNLLHEQSLSNEDPMDTKLLSLMQYHRRDLMTALETTRWQLEDFEREVNFAELSDKSSSRQNAIRKHRQFIIAIREQIVQVEKSVQDLSAEGSHRNTSWMNLNEQDTDILASFLSGGETKEQNSGYGTGNGIMSRFLDSNMDNDEIVELKTEDEEVLPMKSSDNADHVYDSSINRMSWKMAHSPRNHDVNEPAFFHGSAGQKEIEESYKPGAYDLESGGLGAKSSFYKNRFRGTAWGFLSNFWLGNKSKGSFTKRRKDGEIMEDLMENTEQRIYSSNGSISTEDQGLYLQRSASTTKFRSWIELIERTFRRSQYLVSYTRFPVRFAPAVLFVLIVICFLLYLIAR